MQNMRFDQLLTGAAVALALTVTGYSTIASAQSGARSVAAAGAGVLDDISAAAKAAQPPEVDSKADAKKSPPADAVTTPAAPAAAAPTLPPAEAAVAEKLRDMNAGKFDKLLGGRKERTTIEQFYATRNYAPIWITDSALNARGKAAIAYLATVDTEGLDPADYPTPSVAAGADADALADAELRTTDSVLTFARHAQMGRVHFSRVGNDIQYELARPEPADVLGKLASANNVADALASFNPQHPGYIALKGKLADARNKRYEGRTPISTSGPVLRYGKDKQGNEMLMEDPRVPLLRARLGLAGDSQVYDKEVAAAVADFQKSKKMRANGQLNAPTIEAINGPRRDSDSDVILANLERWRWMPRDLGNTYVMVNVPDYTLRVMRSNKLVWTTKIVAGKPSQATPVTSAEMKFITVNPTWNVPPSIIQNEYLPALQQDPQAMERIGLRVEQARDGTIRIWQPPGEKNALGRIRFNFPNKFLVYQHDTPDKHLFAHDKRAYSHGCMRVQDPLKYGEVLLSLVRPGEGYTADRLQKMYGGSEININFPTFIPVHLTYQTAFVDDAGRLVIRDDVYGRDARTLAALKGDQRKVADIPVERPKVNFSAPVRAAPGSFGGGPSFFSSGPSFFERLFGGGFEPPPQQRPRRNTAHDRQSMR